MANLRKTAVSGLIWSFAQQFSGQIITFVVSVLLARLLSPAAFGLIGMLGIFISIGSTLMDSGLTTSLIRTPDADQKDYSTVFFMNIIGSIIFYLLLFFLAPFIALFYRIALLAPLVRVYGLTFIIQAFVGVQRTRLTKHMNFKTQMTIQIPSLIGGGIVGIVLAKMGYGPWSLVWMSLFQTGLSTVQHWIFAGWSPDFLMDKERFKRHFNFGYKIAITNIFSTLYSNIFTLIIGRFYSPAQVGFYMRSLSLRQLPISNLSTALNKVSFPMFSAINQDDVKLKVAYRKVMQQLLFWLTPTLILFAIIATPFIRILLTDKWLPAVPYFRVLCVAGVMYPLRYNLDILKVKGRSGLYMRLEIVKKLYSVAAIFVAVRYGIMTLLYCQLILDIVEYAINSFYCGRIINYPVTEQLADFSPIIFISAIVGFVVWALDAYCKRNYHFGDILQMIIAGVVYTALYWGLSNFYRISAMAEFRQIVFKEMLGRA